MYGLPASDGFTLPVRITRGEHLSGPVCIRPPPLLSPVSNPEPPETGVCMPRMQRLDITFRTPWLVACECCAAACARLCGPGGRVPGYVSRALALRSSSVARRMYDIWHRIHLYVPRAYDRRTLDFHCGDSDFVEQYPCRSATHSCRYARRSLPWCMRQNKSVYDTASATLSSYATQGNHSPCRTVCRHWLS